MFWGPCNGAKFMFWLKLSEMNLTNIQDLWVLEGTKCVSSVCCGAQEMAGLYFSITECSCFFVSWNSSSHVDIMIKVMIWNMKAKYMYLLTWWMNVFQNQFLKMSWMHCVAKTATAFPDAFLEGIFSLNSVKLCPQNFTEIIRHS